MVGLGGFRLSHAGVSRGCEVVSISASVGKTGELGVVFFGVRGGAESTGYAKTGELGVLALWGTMSRIGTIRVWGDFLFGEAPALPRRGEARRAQLALPRGEGPLTPVLGRRRETT